MADNTKILTAEQEQQLRQPIDSYVGGIQEQINALRRDGTDRVIDIQSALDSLKREDLVRILTEPKNALVRQYHRLLEYDNVELSFDEGALEAVADKAIERNIGARGLRAVMEGVLTEIMYDIPSDPTVAKVVITPACVRGECGPTLVRDSGRAAPDHAS